MIEIHINKDVGSYEAKFIGPFTMRQTFCVAAAAPICWYIYQTLTPVISSDSAGFVMFVPAVVAWIIGWTKPYGMRPEMFVRSIFINMILAPANRKYKSDNVLNDVIYSLEKQAVNSEENAEQAEPAEPAEEIIEPKSSSQKKTSRKPKYKVSKEAVS